MNNVSLKQLEIFSDTMIKNVCHCHPCDTERWNKFVCVAASDPTLEIQKVVEYLQAHGWNDDWAWKLGIELEQGISLLKYFEKAYK